MSSAIGNFASDFGGKLKDATGNVTKAVLCVRDLAGKDEDAIDRNNFDKDSEEVQKAILDAAASRMTQGGFDPETSDVSAEDILRKAGRGSSSSNRVLSLEKLSDSMTGRYIPIQVQYNPSSLQYHSDLGGRRRINSVEGIGAGGDGLSIKDIPKNTELTCTLIFERINVNDAFIQASEGWNASLGNATSTAGSIINKVSGGTDAEPYSVRKEVEGFLALLSSTYTRDVIFFYGKLCFHGELTMASATYKMFNKRGDPILAEVAIRIRQDSANLYDSRRWRSSFEALFKDADKTTPPEGAWAKTKDAFSRGSSQIGNAFNGGIF